MGYNPGDIVQNAKGVRLQLGGDGVWHAMGGAPGASVVAPSLSPQERRELETQRQGAATANEVKLRMQGVPEAVKRLGTGPFRGAFLSAAIPEDGGGWMDKIGALAIGGPAKLLGALSDQDVNDYQTIRRLANLGIRQSETGEKGPQTEGDAARNLATTINPSQTVDNNLSISDNALAKAGRQASRADFYSRWAAKYGLNNLNEHGMPVETAFEQFNAAHPQTPAKSGVVITRVK